MIPPSRLAAALLGLMLSGILSAGCFGGPSEADATAHPSNEAWVRQVAMFPWSTKLRWMVGVHDNATREFPDAVVRISVEKRGGVPAGQDETKVLLTPGNDTQVQLTTSNLGLGDYFYKITVSDRQGSVLAVAQGMYEHCGRATACLS